MCTLVFAWRTFPDAPIVAAANRDESLDRPSRPPETFGSDLRVLAPRDVEAGGTWIGVNDRGLFVALTNRWTDVELRGDRSRGLLVRDALGQESAEDAVRYVERELDARGYEPFNLVVADRTAALLVEYDGNVAVRNFDPGVHAVANTGADGRYTIPEYRGEHAREQAANVDRLRTDLQPEPGEDGRSWRRRAREAIRDHDYGVCVHGDGFGTRSSSLLTIGTDSVEYHFADGPPCETEYRRVEVDL
ncbi:NRDE family protein [Halapricum desulfuricans]|uniref:NRDE family protein n=1 Tax=Halapricum desulfuricans TaxID=2841257 RepID=A0A897N0R8_9EURY|nr:NRDE family protein [Halapricum desulfuricans]QSG06532.1 Uncharacterized protein HSR121_2202 [Halapricum desulfuricans]